MIVWESKGENHQTIDTFPLDRPAKIEANKAQNRIEHEQQTFPCPIATSNPWNRKPKLDREIEIVVRRRGGRGHRTQNPGESDGVFRSRFWPLSPLPAVGLAREERGNYVMYLLGVEIDVVSDAFLGFSWETREMWWNWGIIIFCIILSVSIYLNFFFV